MRMALNMYLRNKITNLTINKIVVQIFTNTVGTLHNMFAVEATSEDFVSLHRTPKCAAKPFAWRHTQIAFRRYTTTTATQLTGGSRPYLSAASCLTPANIFANWQYPVAASVATSRCETRRWARDQTVLEGVSWEVSSPFHFYSFHHFSWTYEAVRLRNVGFGWPMELW